MHYWSIHSIKQFAHYKKFDQEFDEFWSKPYKSVLVSWNRPKIKGGGGIYVKDMELVDEKQEWRDW